MSTRSPSVAGSFYPADSRTLRKTVEDCLSGGDPSPALAALVPHAGYMYSGRVAGAVYARIEIPQDVVLLCFHHRSAGADFAVWPAGQWVTPLGTVSVPEDLSEAVRAATGSVFDQKGHLNEHSGEVQVPFLQVLRKDLRLVPVALSVDLDAKDRLVEFGRQLAGLEREFLVICSTDLNHYDPHDVTVVKDEYAIAAIRTLDADGLVRAIREKDVRMCGFAPTLAMIGYAKAKGLSEARLIEHKTSFDAGGDRERTVGYAGLICG